MQADRLVGQPYPLYWPEGWPRASFRKPSKYSRAFARDRDAIVRRLSRMGGTSIIISSNVPLRRDGLPYAGMAQPPDPGVAVYFTRRKRDHVVACDTWKTVDENLRAVLRTIEALAAIERSGSAQIEDRAYQGFARLPAVTTATPTHWSVVLGIRDVYEHEIARAVRDNVPLDRERLRGRAETAYRELAKKHHPDVPAGSHEAFVEFGRAIADARKELRS